MSEEIGQAIQIIKIAYDGIEIVMKLGSGTIEQLKKAIDFIIALLDHEKTLGKTDMRKLLQRGGDLQVFQFQSEDLKQVEKMAKKYGILYSVLPDINKEDGKSEIIFHSEAVPRVNMMIQKLKFGRIATFDDYLKNGNEKDLEQVMSFLKNQKNVNGLHTAESLKANEALDGLIEKVGIFAMEKSTISVEEVKESFNIDDAQAENIVGKLEKMGVLSKEENGKRKVIMNKDAFFNRINGYKELAQRMQTISATQNQNLLDITLTKNLIAEENEHAVKTRIPGTWGGDARYLWVDKQKIMEIHSGKTMLTFIDPDKDYKLYSADNKVIATMKGKDLYDGHYDRVAAEVRKRYGAIDKQVAAMMPKAPAPKRR